MILAQISSVAAYLPQDRLDNAALAKVFPKWTPEKISRKLGIDVRPVADKNETAVDLAVCAAQRLFQEGLARRDQIDFVILCTQSPDYFLPTSACLLQDRLGLPKTCGAFDINLGCSGYVYGLSVAKGLIESRVAKKVLFITSETYTKYINPEDRVTRPLFGDGAAATLLEAIDVPAATCEQSNDVFSRHATLGPFEFGTDGSGAELLMVQAGAARMPATPETKIPIVAATGNYNSREELFMHGAGIFNFSIEVVPELVKRFDAMTQAHGERVDAYIFHQANKFMLDRLRELCDVPEEQFYNNMQTRGNTVSSSIPIALIDAMRDGKLHPGDLALLVGFGVGLSWGACLARLPETFRVAPLS